MNSRVGYGVGVAVVVSFLLALCSVQMGFAVTSTSPNYQLTEPEFGAGSAIEMCSGQYCAHATIGDMSGEEASSPNYTATFGPVSSDDEPTLDIIVAPGTSDLGVLSTDKTASKTTSVQVRSHLSGGYYLQIYGSAPKYGEHSLSTPAITTDSEPGKEQFGINAVANTVPQVGEDPVYTSSEQGVDSVLKENYRVANKFMYKSGDTIAEVTSESSQIHYTISMIVNVAGSTPAGHYTGDFSAVITPVF